jgi:large subunit ribosomal protein L24e
LPPHSSPPPRAALSPDPFFSLLSVQQFLFINRKAKSLALQRKRAAKIAWTTTYRKAHKKDQEAGVARKKRRSTARAVVRPIAGVSVEVLAKRRAEKPEARKATREAAIREVKERSKAVKADKAAQHARPGGARVRGGQEDRQGRARARQTRCPGQAVMEMMRGLRGRRGAGARTPALPPPCCLYRHHHLLCVWGKGT